MNGQLELWEPEPCHDSTVPAPASRTAADRLRALHERRIEPDAGRAVGGWRLQTPRYDNLRITTIQPSQEYL